MSLQAVTCSECGGAVAMEIGAEHPTCLFCGSTALTRAEIPEEVEPPGGMVPFTADEAAADAAFRTFAKSSIWYPSDIRHARLELKPLLLPAWVWSGEIETHYAGLVRSSTRSGKRPVSGQHIAQLTGVLVPASSALTRAELAAISPFDCGGEQPFVPDDLDVPYELGLLTRTAATEAAHVSMQRLHSGQLSGEVGASSLNVSCLYRDMVGRPLLLPVYIGTYRRGKDYYRVVISGQTAALTGTAPLSLWKILGAIFAGLGCLGMVVLFFTLAGAIATQF
ncbi:MAG: hypothetical protein ACI8RZ_007670 [Myxococcota bacterium]